MIGKRKDHVEGHLSLAQGEYGKHADGRWYCVPPGTSDTMLGCLFNHSVTEHEDGTITVSPSILIKDGRSEWHGFLERGVWRTC
jgi:hypothetical protein